MGGGDLGVVRLPLVEIRVGDHFHVRHATLRVMQFGQPVGGAHRGGREQSKRAEHTACEWLRVWKAGVLCVELSLRVGRFTQYIICKLL